MDMSKETVREPHFISSKLLEALGGIKRWTEFGPLVDNGAYLWGVEDREKGQGIFKHVLLVSRVAYALAKALMQRDPKKYGSINLQYVVEVAILHDVAKLYGEDRERKLEPNQKLLMGLRKDFKEFDDETDEAGVRWLKQLGFAKEVYEATADHFPQEEKESIYWKLGLVADYMASQHVMPVGERIADVRKRWIEEKIAEGKEPRMDPAYYDRASSVIQDVARKLFDVIGVSDREFIEREKLNDPTSAQRWETFLTGTRTKKAEARAKRHVKRAIG